MKSNQLISYLFYLEGRNIFLSITSVIFQTNSPPTISPNFHATPLPLPYLESAIMLKYTKQTEISQNERHRGYTNCSWWFTVFIFSCEKESASLQAVRM